MRELSIFVDESGSDGLSDRHYLLTVVMHDQSENIAGSIAAYEGALRAKGLPDIPFHASPLMNGKDQCGQGLLRQRSALHRGIASPRDRVCAVEECGRLPLGAALRVPPVAGGGLHLHHGAHGDQVRRAHRHRDGREILRQVVRFQEGHTEGDAQEARLERRSALGGAFTDNGACYARRVDKPLSCIIGSS